MARFRKKPVEIEAMHLAGTNAQMHAVYRWVEENTAGSFDPYADDVPASGVSIDPATGFLMIATLEGVMQAKPGDWIIKGVQGEFYPCKPDIFEATYDPAGPAGVEYVDLRSLDEMSPEEIDAIEAPLTERLPVIRDRAEFWASRDPEGAQRGLYDRHAVEFARELVEVLEHLDTVTTNRDAFMGINDDLREVIAERKAKQEAAEAAVGRARALADARSHRGVERRERAVTAREHLDRCLHELEAKEYFNGGQTSRDRYPFGSEERARIVAEAAFWQGQIDREEAEEARVRLEAEQARLLAVVDGPRPVQ